LLSAAEAVPGQHDDGARANLRETRRAFDRATKLPSRLVEEIARTTVLAQNAWVEARKKSSYPEFQPWLEKVLVLKREEAACVAVTGQPHYDALLDEFEPDETSANLRVVFEKLRVELVELVGKIADSPRKAPVHLLHRHYPIAAQERLSRFAAERIGFDFNSGRLDRSVHPFCSDIGPGDTRMTTRYDENYFGDALFSVLHESGHGLYDQGLPAEHFGTPLGEAVSLGIHESQSRMWENLVGRSRSFWKFMMPQTRETFPDALAGVSEDNWMFAINHVSPSFIRTESDETTYNLHILLRFELEQAMLSGDLNLGDLPAAWNEKMRTYLGITPSNDAEGCLQDIHWSGGAIGYFPTYTLGNLIAAQLFEAANREIPDLQQQFASGQFGALLTWLRERIHRHGKRFTAAELVLRATGSPLSAEPLTRHLRSKAVEYYGV
jgi:carboxypeptidase Taq